MRSGPGTSPPSAEVSVEVWCALIDQPAAVQAWLHRKCSPGEQARAQRMADSACGRRWLTGRGILRAVLSERLSGPARNLAIRTAPGGKPWLPHPATDVRFNVSHSHGWLFVALADGHDVGVDVQFIDPAVDIDAIARCFFTPRERRMLGAGTATGRRRLFFSMWTLKEAWLKAMGSGLSRPLASAEILTMVRSQPTPDSKDDAQLWTSDRAYVLTELPAPTSFKAALAAERCSPHVELHRWPRFPPLDRRYQHAGSRLPYQSAAPLGAVPPTFWRD